MLSAREGSTGTGADVCNVFLRDPSRLLSNMAEPGSPEGPQFLWGAWGPASGAPAPVLGSPLRSASRPKLADFAEQLEGRTADIKAAPESARDGKEPHPAFNELGLRR